MPATHFWVLQWLLAALLLMQLLIHVLGKPADDNSSNWVPVTHVEDKDGVPGFWLRHGPAQAFVAICTMNYQLGIHTCVCVWVHVCACMFLSFCLSNRWKYMSKTFRKIARSSLCGDFISKFGLNVDLTLTN